MTLTRGAQRAFIAISCGLILAIYAIAWFAPAVGLDHEDAARLVTAKSLAAGHGYSVESLPDPIPRTQFPPLFPALLALFTLVSQQAQWLKLLPLLCAFGWLFLTWRLLLKMGATNTGALLLVALTALSPCVVSMGANLLSESLFALLITAAFLTLLNDRNLLAGTFAGLAVTTQVSGLSLIAACIVTLIVRRRFRAAGRFTLAAMIIAAPWLGWYLAHTTRLAPDIFTGMPANEILQVLGANLLRLLAGPFAVLTGIDTTYAVLGALLLFGWSLLKRRQMVPDLFIALYCLMLLFRTQPPERLLAPILPLFLWILWRVFQHVRIQEALAAALLILAALALWADVSRIPPTLRFGAFPVSRRNPADWNEMRKLFGYIRGNTPADAILLANLDSLFYLNTGRKAIRGFSPDGYKLNYQRSDSAVTPNELFAAIVRNGVGYVALTPDRDLPESASFHKSVEALERGGILQPVGVPALAPEYRLLRVASFRFR